MEVSTYLARIGFEGDPNTSLDCLSRLQAAHQHAVPYENLDVFLGRKKLLEVGELYQKMVLEERGGWCCELNGLFCWLLQAIGFTVRRVSASYYMEDKQKYKEEFDHLALIVTISEQEYLVDVGWGQPNQPLAPIRLSSSCPHSQPSGDYRLQNDNDGHMVLEHCRLGVMGHHNSQLNKEGGDWYPVFRFSPEGRELDEFQTRCNEYETDPENSLATVPMAIVKKENGRKVGILVGTRFTMIEFRDGCSVRENQEDLGDEDLNRILKEVFKISLKKPLGINKIMEENKVSKEQKEAEKRKEEEDAKKADEEKKKSEEKARIKALKEKMKKEQDERAKRGEKEKKVEETETAM